MQLKKFIIHELKKEPRITEADIEPSGKCHFLDRKITEFKGKIN